MLPSNATRKAATVGAVHAVSAKVVPVTTMDSPSAMMMNSAQRSAMWPPSTSQSLNAEAPKPGTRKRIAGLAYSIATAALQSASRPLPSARPPEIQNTPLHAMRQRFMRMAGSVAGIDRAEITERPTCMPVKASAKTRPAVERLRDRRRQQKARDHHREQHDADRGAVRIEPVGDPGGEDPYPPHRQEQDGGLEHAERREMRQQRVGELRDCEDKDEVEEQLDVGDAMMAVWRTDPQQTVLAGGRHRDVPAAQSGTPVCSARACSTPPIWPLSD